MLDTVRIVERFYSHIHKAGIRRAVHEAPYCIECSSTRWTNKLIDEMKFRR